MIPCPEPGCEVLVLHLERHLNKKHPSSLFLREMRAKKNRIKKPEPADPSKTPDPKPRKKPCPSCGRLLSQMALDIHVEGCPKNRRFKPAGIELPFEILPPGLPDTKLFLRKKNQRLGSEDRFGIIYRWSRFYDMEILGGTMTHYGTKAWSGYCVFEFPGATRVVLESPIEGNAAYVLSGDWKQMEHRHKADIRREFSGQYTKVVHRGGHWLRRVDGALLLKRKAKA